MTQRTVFIPGRSTPLHIQRVRYLEAVAALLGRKLSSGEELFVAQCFEGDFSCEDAADAIMYERKQV